jgi:opacity protein-like surface antigen
MMNKFIFKLVASVAPFLAFGAACAADMSPPQAHSYLHLDGTYALGGAGGGIQNGFDPTIIHQGSGGWASGYFGYVMPSGWDIRFGGGYAGLGAGATNGTGANIYGIDHARMFNLDADVGYEMGSGEMSFRPSLGVRYLNWNQYQGFHPDSPLGCCWMDSTFGGIGPKLGVDMSAPLANSLSLVAGANASLLIGNINYTTGTGSPASTGAQGRNVLTLGGYAGLEWAVSDTVSIGARYNMMYLGGTSYDNQHLFAVPTGTGTNLLHGPSASLTVKF